MTERIAAALLVALASVSWSPVSLALAATSLATSVPSRLTTDAVSKLLAASKVPSVAIAVIRGGRVVRTLAFGEQSPGVPATPRTLYNIASLTKPISAEAFLRLASKGGFALDDPMARFWLDPDIAADSRVQRLTPRLSLTHRTGFPNWRSRTAGLAFVRDPGQYGYSGEGFVYLARYVTKRSGNGLEPLVQTLVLDPAGMKDTAMTSRSWFAGRIALPTDADGKSLQPAFAKQANPADLAYTTAGDYARFLLQVMGDKGLRPDIAAQRRTVQADMKADTCAHLTPAACPDQIGFGLGWQVIVIGSQKFFMHTGSDDGVATFAYVSPTNHTGLVILTNGARGGALYLPIIEAVGQDPALASLLKAMSK